MTDMTVRNSTGDTETIRKPPPLGQSAKVGSIPVTLASDEDLLALFGALAANPNAQSLLGRVKAVADAISAGIGLAAGENHVGAIGGHTKIATALFARPGDATAYAAGDLVANNTAAGSVVPLTFDMTRVNGGTGLVRRARLSTTHTALAGTEIFRLHLFRAAPTPANGDNGAFSVNGVTAIHLGYFDITLDRVFNDGSKGIGVPAAGGEITFDAIAGTKTLFGLLEARTNYAPTTNETFTVALEAWLD